MDFTTNLNFGLNRNSLISFPVVTDVQACNSIFISVSDAHISSQREQITSIISDAEKETEIK